MKHYMGLPKEDKGSGGEKGLLLYSKQLGKWELPKAQNNTRYPCTLWPHLHLDLTSTTLVLDFPYEAMEWKAFLSSLKQELI